MIYKEDFKLTFVDAMRELEQGKEIISEFSPNVVYYLDENGDILTCTKPKYSDGNYFVIEDGYFDKKCLKSKWMVRE